MSTPSTAVSTPARDSEEGIQIEQAQQEFENLSRNLSKQSADHRINSGDKDLESNSEDDFDLQAYLQSNAEASAAVGIKRKLVGVTFENLTVLGASSTDIRIRTFQDTILNSVLFAPKLIAGLFGVAKPKSRKLLDGFSGAVKPGEMCLVLARPGGGASTFLKTISNNRDGFLGVDGNVEYAGIDAREFGKLYKGEVVYNQEDDIHHYSLTVKQTLDFALKLKTPGKLLPEQTKADFVETVRNSLLKMLNIYDSKDTVVGNEFLRGISGGQKKRVSIAEMMCTRAAVLAYDNSSRGLDASTALDYAKSIRLLTNINQTSTFVSLYQAGEGIYNQFDKVLLIDQGKQVYFGPANEARSYMVSLGFLDLPRQTSGDWLCGVTDPLLAPESRFQPGRDASNVPSTSEAMAEAYLQSDVRRRMIQEMEDYMAELAREKGIEEEFRAAVREDKNRGVISKNKSVYTVSFFSQVYALFIRNLQITVGHPFDLIFSYQSTVILALILGSTYINLPETALGAFSRGGLLFISVLFNALVAFSELPMTMNGRPILFKQKSFALFRPSAFGLAGVLSEIPFSAPRLFLFCVITFFMTGLNRNIGGFFTFYINVYFCYLAMVAVFKLFGSVTSDKDVAARLGAVLIIAIALYSNYFLPREETARWLFWISYLDPLWYGFGALMINEFKNLELQCVGDYIVPRNLNGQLPQYLESLSENQVCTLRGSSPGQSTITGMAYLDATFGYSKISDQWLYFGVILVFFIGVTALNMLVIEIFTQGAFNSSLSIIKKSNAEEEKLNFALKERRANKDQEDKESTENNLQLNACSFTWEKLNYTVPVKGGEKRLLHEFTVIVNQGSSGAGKTTLLDVLADRKSIGVISGDRLVDGKTFGSEFQRGCGYAEQQDIHEGTATLREALRFSAYLRQPAHVSKEEKDAWVEECISLLELDELSDAMIGTPEFGLGVGDRKRATIAVELAAKPDLLLFLDEPTSGLDGQTAYNVVRFLKKLSNAGQAILCTIHQPSSLLFEQFDRLLLLEKGGETVYFGPVGKDSKDLVKYFSDNGAQCPSDVNPAEYMLDAIGAGSQKRVGPRPWCEVYRDSELFQENLREIEMIKQEVASKTVDENLLKTEYATSYLFQLKTVFKRTMLSSWRNADYQYTRIFFHGAIALLASTLFLQVSDSASSVQSRVFAIFTGVVLPAIILQQIEPFYIGARAIFIREDSSKMYYPTVFSLSQLLSELPYVLICAVVYFLLFYFPTGLSSDSGRASYFFAMTLVSELFSVTFGEAISAISPSVYIASLATPFFIAIFNLFCGVTIPKNVIPGVWRTWLYYLNPYTHYMSGLLANELYDLKINCRPEEFNIFQPPTGQTCGEWGSAFVEAGPGYINNLNATSDCQYCQFDYGQDYYEPLDIDWKFRAREIGILLAMCGSNIIILLIASKYLRYSKR